MTPEQTIAEHGPRVLARYGRNYYNGWCAGLRAAADYIVAETRNATGAPGANEAWDTANRNAEAFANRLHRVAKGTV